MLSIILGGIVSLLKAALIPLTFMWVGRNKAKREALEKELEDVKTGNKIEEDIDRMSDDAVRKQLLDDAIDKR